MATHSRQGPGVGPTRRRYSFTPMPELPDITVYVEALERRIVGQPIEEIRLSTPFLLRTVEPPLAALIGTFEPILGPIWVWLVHGEEPSERTLLGGAIVFAAVLAHIALEFRRRARPSRPGVAGLPNPH